MNYFKEAVILLREKGYEPYEIYGKLSEFGIETVYIPNMYIPEKNEAFLKIREEECRIALPAIALLPDKNEIKLRNLKLLLL